MAKSNLVKINKMIEEKVKGGYKRVEDTVTGSYKKIEDRVVDRYEKIEDKYVDNYLTEDGETIEEAKVRLKNKKK